MAQVSEPVHTVSPEPSFPHAHSIEVEEGSGQKLDLQLPWIHQHWGLKGLFVDMR